MSDTIIQEIRNTRDELAKRFHDDIHELCAELRREQEPGSAPVVDFSFDPVSPGFVPEENSAEREGATPG